MKSLMKSLSQYIKESLVVSLSNIPEIVLAIRLLDGKHHAIFYTEDNRKSFKHLVYDIEETDEIKNEIDLFNKWLVKFNGNGYKTADELDRLNDLHELSKDEVKQLDWYDTWWKKVGTIGQDWLIAQ